MPNKSNNGMGGKARRKNLVVRNAMHTNSPTAYLLPRPSSTPLKPEYRNVRLRNIKKRLQLLDKQPFIVRNIRPIKLLKRINTFPRNERI